MNAEVKVYCPHCTLEVEFDPSLSGEEVQCPRCDRHFQMPKRSVVTPAVVVHSPPVTSSKKSLAYSTTQRRRNRRRKTNARLIASLTVLLLGVISTLVVLKLDVFSSSENVDRRVVRESPSAFPSSRKEKSAGSRSNQKSAQREAETKRKLEARRSELERLKREYRVRERKAKQDKKRQARIFPKRKPAYWIGKQIIILPKPKTIFGYPHYSIHNRLATIKDRIKDLKKPKYRKLGGRTGVVTNSYLRDGGGWIEFTMDDNRERLSVELSNGEFQDIALLDEIKKARKEWKGKRLWTSQTWINHIDAKTGFVSKKHVGCYTPVKIVDVQPGFHHYRPVRLVLETDDGEKGFVDFNPSLSNAGSRRKYLDMALLNYLYWDNPLPRLDWPERFKFAARWERIEIGMNKKQVEFILGPVSEVNRTRTALVDSEQWIFRRAGKYVYFEHGVVVAVQD